MSELKSRITEDMKNAMRAKDAPRLSALRLLLAAIKQREVDERRDQTDGDVVAAIERMLKQRRDSISQFEAAQRHDLADAEKFEVSVLQVYMPQALSEAEIEAIVTEAMARLGVAGPKDMGRLMADLKPKLAGQADMTLVSALVKGKLAGH